MTEYITKRDAELVLRQFKKGFRRTDEICAVNECILEIQDMDTVDAVEVTRIEEVKRAILQTFDNLIAIHRNISNSPLANSAKYLDIPESSNDYNGIYADAMEVARRFVNVAFTELCDKNGQGE
jgi:hypothetical protein